MCFWENMIGAWIAILERWAEAVGEEHELTGAARVDKRLSTSGADLVPGGPELPTGMARGPDPAAGLPEQAPAEREIPHERQPAALAAARHVRRTLTRTTRRDLARLMTDMCEPGGWRVTTLNPDLPDARKFAILSDRFDKIALTDDAHVLYSELLALAAVAVGWAQGIARRQWRDAKRATRAKRRARRARRRGDHVREPGTVPGLDR